MACGLFGALAPLNFSVSDDELHELNFPQATFCPVVRIGCSSEQSCMTKVDHARLVQALQDTSTLVACNVDREKYNTATSKLQHSIALLLGELNKDWCDLAAQHSAQPSVGIPD
jgi:hypothetical protein